MRGQEYCPERECLSIMLEDLGLIASTGDYIKEDVVTHPYKSKTEAEYS